MLPACGQSFSAADSGGGANVDAEAGTGGDGGTPQDGDAGMTATGFCSTRTGYTLCADFDQGFFDMAWQSHTIMGGSLATDGTASTSPPDSLLATFSTGSMATEALLTSTFPAKTSVSCDFDVRLDQVDPTGATVAIIGFDEVVPSPAYYHVYLEVGLTSASVKENGDSAGFHGYNLATSLPASAKPSPPPTNFTHVTMALDLGASTVSVKLNGSSALDLSTLKPSPGSSGIVINLGPNSAAAMVPTDWAIRFDNVLCTLSP